jgi:hypothetical protein
MLRGKQEKAGVFIPSAAGARANNGCRGFLLSHPTFKFGIVFQIFVN